MTKPKFKLILVFLLCVNSSMGQVRDPKLTQFKNSWLDIISSLGLWSQNTLEVAAENKDILLWDNEQQINPIYFSKDYPLRKVCSLPILQFDSSYNIDTMELFASHFNNLKFSSKGIDFRFEIKNRKYFKDTLVELMFISWQDLMKTENPGYVKRLRKMYQLYSNSGEYFILSETEFLKIASQIHEQLIKPKNRNYLYQRQNGLYSKWTGFKNDSIYMVYTRDLSFEDFRFLVRSTNICYIMNIDFNKNKMELSELAIGYIYPNQELGFFGFDYSYLYVKSKDFKRVFTPFQVHFVKFMVESFFNILEGDKSLD